MTIGVEAPKGSRSVERTFCFVDLAGFTALTEVHGDTEAVALLDRFLEVTQQWLGPDDELVKSIGDAVLLACPTPRQALRTVMGLISSCQELNGFPLPRAGAHHGPAIARHGDYLGGSVNLAARVTGHASGGQFLVTASVADVARELSMDVVSLGSHRLRNLSEPVHLFEVRPSDSGVLDTVDPVCRMRIDREQAAGTLHHDGHDYWFCTLACAGAFTADPDRYLTPPPRKG